MLTAISVSIDLMQCVFHVERCEDSDTSASPRLSGQAYGNTNHHPPIKFDRQSKVRAGDWQNSGTVVSTVH